MMPNALAFKENPQSRCMKSYTQRTASVITFAM